MSHTKFEWQGKEYWKSDDFEFPVTVIVYTNGLYDIRESQLKDHYKRLRLVRQKRWTHMNQIGRQSPIPKNGSWFLEFTHALKNIVVEELRRLNIWNRKNRDPLKPDGYIFRVS